MGWFVFAAPRTCTPKCTLHPFLSTHAGRPQSSRYLIPSTWYGMEKKVAVFATTCVSNLSSVTAEVDLASSRTLVALDGDRWKISV